MDSLEHVRSSSSPSVRVSELRREGTDGSVLRVRLDDGSLFLLDADHPLLPRFHAGDLLGEDTLQLLESAADTYSCRRKALDLIGRAEQSRQGLFAKLVSRGFPRDAIITALDRLEAAGTLNDRRFSEAWVRSRLRMRPEGPVRLRAALAAKGVSSAVAGEAVEAVLEEIDDQDSGKALQKAWEKLSRRTGITGDKLMRGLVRRGFSPGKVARFLKSRENMKGNDDSSPER